MDHDTVVRDSISEKYLLDELEPQLRDEFEEHFFLCPECAGDVYAGSEFVAYSKEILAKNSQLASLPRRLDRQNWFARLTSWFRPAFAVPALAALLVVLAYQNLVTFPRLTRALNQAQILPAATVNLLTYGANANPLSVASGQSFLLNVIVPPGKKYDNYRADLYDPAGKLQVSLPIAGSSGGVTGDVWSIRFPAASQSGIYKLNVYGISDGAEVQVGSGSFELQIQK
jgi:hypothetical protein